jgi:amidase
VTRWLRESQYKTTLEDATASQQAMVQNIMTVFGDADILLSPTVAMPPPPIAGFETDDPAAWFSNAAQAGALTAVFNLTTGPAATLPLGLLDGNLPYGVQIGGHLHGDHQVLALSRQLEEAMPWRSRRSPVFDS